MILSKYKFYIGFCLLLLILFTVGIMIGKGFNANSKEFLYYSSPVITGPDKPENTGNDTDLKIPLPVPSQITTEKNKIRLDLEKIAVNRFFIVYSVIYGNQSHTAYHLFLTDLNKEKLNHSLIGDIYLETGKNEIIKPIAAQPVIQGFPADEPLGWKIKITAKFPYKAQRNVHKLILYYEDEKYTLTGIYY